MPAWSADDLVALFAPGELGELVQALYTPYGGAPVSITVNYMAPSRDMNLALGVICTTEPTLRVPGSTVPAISKKDLFTVAGTQYKVTDFKFDGFGITTITLSL